MPECIVESKPRPREMVSIRLSGGRFFTVPQSEDIKLEPGTLLSDEDIERLAHMDQYVRGRSKALRLLAIRPRTRREISDALDVLEIARAIRNGVIIELEEAGLVDDRRFAREYVRSRVDVKGLGPHRLKFDLSRLGVSESLVEEVIRSEIDDDSQEEVAWRLVRKKLGERTPTERDVRRITGYLQRKGLDYEIINRVAYELLQQARNVESFD